MSNHYQIIHNEAYREHIGPTYAHTHTHTHSHTHMHAHMTGFRTGHEIKSVRKYYIKDFARVKSRKVSGL